MKACLCVLYMLLTSSVFATEPPSLKADELQQKVQEITLAQNKVMMQGSTEDDVDKLFSLYSDEFSYIHEAYGGTYTKKELYANTLRLLKRGLYNKTEQRYTLVSTIPGYNSIAVERQETYQGNTVKHLAVFEFRGDKVTKIVEYWK